MAAEIPNAEPLSFVAGDTVKFTRSFPAYSAVDGWVLSYEFRGVGVLTVTADADDADGAGFSITIPSSETQGLGAGQYRWFARVSLAGEVFTVDSGTVAVWANPAAAVAGDLQSPTERELALVDAQIAELLLSPNEAYAVGGRSASKRSLPDLLALRGTLNARLCRENGGQAPSHAGVFRAPSC